MHAKIGMGGENNVQILEELAAYKMRIGPYIT